MRVAVYPGSFDPITNGHCDLIKRAAKLFDTLLVVVGKNMDKQTFFTAEERKLMIEEALNLPNVKVFINQFQLTVEFARLHGAEIIVRGVRAFQDYEYELQMALMNRRLDPSIETIFLMPKNEYSFVSSSLIKNVASYQGDIEKYVPKNVFLRIKEKFSK